jgi:hypothetical protein
VSAWWRRWPAANIGLPTGAASGADVVDVDLHTGGSGYHPFELARAAGYAEGWAWLVRTPSGGLHAYFLRTPSAGSVEQRSWQLPGRHMDFRGDGGYIVAPPSQLASTDGRTRPYELIAVATHELRSLDAVALREFLDPPRPFPGRPASPSRGSRPDLLAEWVAAQPEGGRNAGLFWAACRMAEDGCDVQQTHVVLGEAARSAGLPDREAERTIRSAYRSAAPPSQAHSQCEQQRSSTTVEAVGL